MNGKDDTKNAPDTTSTQGRGASVMAQGHLDEKDSSSQIETPQACIFPHLMPRDFAALQEQWAEEYAPGLDSDERCAAHLEWVNSQNETPEIDVLPVQSATMVNALVGVAKDIIRGRYEEATLTLTIADHQKPRLLRQIYGSYSGA